MRYKLIFSFILLALHCSSFAQFEFPPLSPKGNIKQIVGNTILEVEYERPSARNRIIFGDLVPWNKVWRTGAGYCTKISFSKQVIINNQKISSGTYSLLTIPNKDEWIIILNSDTTLYGSGKYNKTFDITRFNVKSNKTKRYYETLTIDIDIIPNNASIYISWEQTQVHFKVSTSTDKISLDYINNMLLTEKEKDADQYGMGADYLLYQNTHYNDALLLADKMIALGGNIGWAHNIKTSVFENLQLYKKASKEIEKHINYIKIRPFEKEIYRKQELNRLKNKLNRLKNKQ